MHSDQFRLHASDLMCFHFVQVGDYYKTPNYPIWVVGSSSHYTVLFALNENVGKVRTYFMLASDMFACR